MNICSHFSPPFSPPPHLTTLPFSQCTPLHHLLVCSCLCVCICDCDYREPFGLRSTEGECTPVNGECTVHACTARSSAVVTLIASGMQLLFHSNFVYFFCDNCVIVLQPISLMVCIRYDPTLNQTHTPRITTQLGSTKRSKVRL